MNPKTVLFFQSSFSAVCRRSAVGVQRFAAEAGWRLPLIIISVLNSSKPAISQFKFELSPVLQKIKNGDK